MERNPGLSPGDQGQVKRITQAASFFGCGVYSSFFAEAEAQRWVLWYHGRAALHSLSYGMEDLAQAAETVRYGLVTS